MPNPDLFFAALKRGAADAELLAAIAASPGAAKEKDEGLQLRSDRGPSHSSVGCKQASPSGFKPNRV